MLAVTCTDMALLMTAKKQSSRPRLLIVAAELTASAMAEYPRGGKTVTPVLAAKFCGLMYGRMRRRSEHTCNQ